MLKKYKFCRVVLIGLRCIISVLTVSIALMLLKRSGVMVVSALYYNTSPKLKQKLKKAAVVKYLSRGPACTLRSKFRAT